MTNRRQFIGAAAGSLITAGCTQMGSMTKPTFVLVHGAWHGGWCWQYVKAELEGSGYRVIAPSLTGLGDKTHLLTADVGLQTHVDDIVSQIESQRLNDIILVGHSYGGMVVTGVSDALQSRLRHVVYLDAVVPVDGESMLTVGSPPQAQVDETLARLQAFAPDGIAMQPFAPEVFGIAPDHERYTWVADHLTPHPIKSWVDSIQLKNGGATNLPRSFIHAVEPVLSGSNIPRFAEMAKNDPAWAYHEVATGHDVMVTEPEILSGLLLELVDA